MKKDRVILEKLGSLAVMAFFPLLLKVSITTGLLYVLGIVPNFLVCLLYSVAAFASDNFNIFNTMFENGCHT